MNSAGRTVGMAQRRRRWPTLLLFAGATLGGLLPGAVSAVATELVAYTMRSGSMIPTLLVGDYFYVLKSPDPHAPPHRGDVMVLTVPSTGKEWIKRVIGLPGDTIQMRAGHLRINGTEVMREPAGDYLDSSGATLTRYREHLPGGPAHEIVEKSDRSQLDDTPLFTVPSGHVFVLGDNRDNSQDSRLADFGFIPVESLIGRVTFIYWSGEIDRIGLAVE